MSRHDLSGSDGEDTAFRSKSSLVLLGVAIAACCALRYGLAAQLGLSDDEAYYWTWSLSPALSYLDHPPMVAWLIACGQALAGQTELGVRLIGPILLAAGAVVQWRIASYLTDRQTAMTATWLFLAAPLLNIGGIVITPDLPSVFFYGLTVLCLVELDRSQNANWWLAVGLCAGLGLLSKYTNLFAGATILIWLLAVRENRKWFYAPQLWLGGLLAALLFCPVLLWNAENDWASFNKQFGRVVTSQGLAFKYLGEWIGTQFALLGPLTAALALWGMGRNVKAAVQDRAATSVLLAASYMPLVLYFLLHSLQSRVQGNWLAPAYPALLLCAALALQAMPRHSRRPSLIASLVVGFAMTAVVYAHAVVPLMSLRKDPTAQMRGWPEFLRSIDALAKAEDARWFATSSYATTAQLAWHSRGGRHSISVSQLNQRLRYMHLPADETGLRSWRGLYVELERRSDEALLKRCFAHSRRIGMVQRNGGVSQPVSYAVFVVSGYLATCQTGSPELRFILAR